MGPVKAFKLIEEVKTIENVIKRLEKESDDPKKKKKYVIPEAFMYKEARKLFVEPDAITDEKVIIPLIKWDKPDEEALKEFLVE